MRYVLHSFRSTETIDAVIRLKGRHNYSSLEMKLLRQAFNDLNGFVLPRPGMVYKIPLAFEATDEFGNVIDTSPSTDTATPGDAGAHETTE